MRVDFQTYKTTNHILPVNTSNTVKMSFKKTGFDVVSFGNNTDFINLPVNDIIERIDESIKPGNLLGRGGEAAVYKIIDSDYCVRIPHQMQEDYKRGFISELSDFEKVNHGVAKLGEKTIIMKRLDGYSMFPRPETGVTRPMVHSMIDDMPISAYRQILKQIYEAYDKGAYFDSTGANVIVNPVKKTMTVIDFTDSLDCAYPRFIKSLFTTLGMRDDYLTVAQQKDRANKIFSSVIDDFLPGHKPMMRIADYSFTEFVYALNHQNLIGKAYADIFNKILNEIKDLKYLSIRGVQGSDEQLLGQIKRAKSLVTQLLT